MCCASSAEWAIRGSRRSWQRPLGGRGGASTYDGLFLGQQRFAAGVEGYHPYAYVSVIAHIGLLEQGVLSLADFQEAAVSEELG